MQEYFTKDRIETHRGTDAQGDGSLVSRDSAQGRGSLASRDTDTHWETCEDTWLTQGERFYCDKFNVVLKFEKKERAGNMPRKPRTKSETGIYHVMVRGIGQQDIFYEEEDFLRYLETTEKVSLESAVSVLGYCLMANHVHLLLKENHGDISLFMKRLGVSYASWYNWKYERTGHVFQDRFKSECVEDDAYLLTVIRYIHQNPIKASIVGNPEEYEWSSCAAYYNSDHNKALFPDTELILGIVHRDKQKAIEAFQKYTNEANEDCCLDCNEPNRISESEAYEILKKKMNGKQLTAIRAMDPSARNIILNHLRNEGLSLRQICRITGLPFHIVRKA